MRILHLIIKNLGRNRVRTGLTALAIAVLAAILTLVSSVTHIVNSVVDTHSSQTKLIVRERWVVPSRFPIRYVNQISQLSGIVDWTVWHLYAGFLDISKGKRGGGVATTIENLTSMHEGLEDLDPRLIEAMLDKRNGVLIGKQLSDQLDWQVGQRFTATSLNYPGKDLEFEIVGIIDSDAWGRNYFFRQDYFQDGVGNHEDVNLMWLRVEDQATARRLAAEIEGMFANSPAQLMVETESAGAARFIGRTDTIVNIINFVVVVLVVNMTIVLANSISMTVRERRSEMAILKILGFGPSFVLITVVGEAVLVGTLAGLAGSLSSYVASWVNGQGLLPMRIEFLTLFPVRAHLIVQGVLIGTFVGFAGSIVPAWHAQRTKVDEAFSQVG